MQAHTVSKAPALGGQSAFSMGRSVRSRITREITHQLSQCPGASRVADTTHRDRIKTLVQVYSDLWAAGYRVEEIKSLRPVHLHALVTHWRGRVKREVALRRWTRIRSWCATLGKAGMAPDFASVWPPGQGEETPTKRPVTTPGMSQEQYEWTQAQLLAKGKQQTYLLMRAIRELGLTREEAVLLKPVVGLLPDKARLVTTHQRGKKSRAIRLDTPEKAELSRLMAEHVRSTGRETIGWPNLTTSAQVSRYAKQIQALNRKWEGLLSRDNDTSDGNTEEDLSIGSVDYMESDDGESN